ncbi:MAG: hypothetical protein KAI22_00375 [Gammaproteobacteria bacterium]|nr:hypothetical protein [Gammaproteobacteria bacterium]
MTKLREMVSDNIISNNEQQKIQDKAMIFITMAFYLLSAGTLMEYVSIATLLKVIGFMLTGQAFYFLWKSNTLSRF